MSVDISKFKVADLKRELKARDLSTSGNKQELMDRLQEAVNTKGGIPPTLSTSISISEAESGDEEIGDAAENLLTEDLDEEKLLNTPTDIPTSTTSTTNSLKRKSESQVSSSSESLAQPKRISLGQHSKISFNEETSTENSTTITKPSTPPVIESAIDTERKVIKLSGLTEQERLELRAKKFNVPLPTEALKEARAERFGLTKALGGATSVKSNTPSVDSDLLKKRAERFGMSATPSATTTAAPLTSSDLEEKKKARAARFGLNAPSTVKPVATVTNTDDVLTRRAQRFRIVI